MLTCFELSKKYSSGCRQTVAVNLASEHFVENTAHVIRGKSGSGKTTLLRLLAGLEVPSSGSLNFKNIDMRNLNERENAELRRKYFGFIFQDYRLMPRLTVFDNIALPLMMNDISNIKTKVEKIASELEIFSTLKKYPYELSGGQQQRVAIARAVIHDPLVVFADEPTGNLDEATASMVTNYLFDCTVASKKMLILVTHDTTFKMPNHLPYLMRDGKLSRVEDEQVS